MPSPTFQSLTEDNWRSIALYLAAADVLSFLSVHRDIDRLLSTSLSFWTRLLARDRDEEPDSQGMQGESCGDARKQFMLHAYMARLSAVEWIPLDLQGAFPVSAREGHLACVLEGPRRRKSLVITGGFSDDDGVVVVALPAGANAHARTWGWTRLSPRVRPSFVYGATLTALPPADSTSKSVHVAKAVRFGGFQSGGYTHETNEVWLLVVRHETLGNGVLRQTATWEKVEPRGAAPAGRAYHSATLLRSRWLVILGGMTYRGSTLEEAILDTHTWTWSDVSLACTGEPRPLGRHGHSVVWDARRDRLVMFGGGSGFDLLRSGVDNNEVWELRMNGNEVPSFGGTPSQKWRWSVVHPNTVLREVEDGSDEEEKDANDMDSTCQTTAHCLSPAESLCLGRCHSGMKISPDTVLLLFGGGRPNTNGVLGYDLEKNTFLRPRVKGPLPAPRFTGVAAFLETEGYVFVHGGYNSQTATSIHDMNVLDLGPLLRRRFTALPINRNRRSSEAVTDEEVIGWGQRPTFHDDEGNASIARYLYLLSQGQVGMPSGV